MQFTAHRDAEDDDPYPFTLGDQGFEDLLSQNANGFSRMYAAGIILPVGVKSLQEGDIGLTNQTDRIGLAYAPHPPASIIRNISSGFKWNYAPSGYYLKKTQ